VALHLVCRPELFDLPIHVHKDKVLSADVVFEFFWEARHVLVCVKDDEWNALAVEAKVVRNAPFALVAVVDSLSVEVVVGF